MSGLRIAVLFLSLAAGLAAQFPTADQVISRGRTDLGAVLVSAISRTTLKEAPQPVLLVLDPTPYLLASTELITDALLALGKETGDGGSWRLAVLGSPSGPEVSHPALLVPQVLAAPKREQRFTNTLEALERSLRGLPNGCRVVYLADWHFEDDWWLEGFISRLRRGKHVLWVIGSEASSGSGWLDGLFPPYRLERDGSGETIVYDLHVGRNPFQALGDSLPYHAGDTAWPHVPWHWHGAWWSTRWPVPRQRKPKKTGYDRPRPRAGNPDLEDLRLRIDKMEREAGRHVHGLPSGFGPYGLMRACAMTGGRYVLWSWNRDGRTDVTLDSGRLDLYPPDLRDRATILREIPKRRLARAIAAAWHREADGPNIAGVTPPVTPRGLPAEYRESDGSVYIHYRFDERQDWVRFLREAPPALRELDASIAILDAALAQGRPSDPVDRRYFADADHLRHVLLVHRFTIGEAWHAARRGGGGPFGVDGVVLGIDPVRVIPTGRDPDAVARIPGVKVRNEELLTRLLEDRRRILRVYRGTPIGETVARNSVQACALEVSRVGRGNPRHRNTPAETGPQRPPNTGSGRGRPGTTGR